MKNLTKNSKGFISLNVALIFMTFISLYLTAAFAIALSQQRDYVRSTCVNEGFEVQRSALKNIRQLFALNSSSSIIRFAIKETKIELALAAATQPQLVPVLEARLNTLYESQKALDTIQQGLITKAKFELQAKHLALIFKLNKDQRELSNTWQSMLTMSSYFIARTTPTLAIRPDSEGGIGPNYEWQEDAERKQTLAYAWNMFFQTNQSYQNIFSWMNVLSLTCSISPNLGDKQWQLTINADK